ncbi:MAG: hypothetical protein IPK67_07915 [Planctomycetes bacterium]|nr:hypothetical protein [Planctomycetota bacterium]
MSKPSLTNDPSLALRGTQVIVLALAGGVVLFATVAAVVGPMSHPMEPVAFGLDPIALLAVFLSFTAVAASFFVPGRVVEAAREGTPDARANAFRSSRIIGAAMLEGPALLWSVALLLSGHRLYFIPVAILVALIGLQVPTREAFESATGLRIRGD